MVETAGKASKAYIFPCFSGFYVQVWAIYVRWSVFGGQSGVNQNQPYLIQLGEGLPTVFPPSFSRFCCPVFFLPPTVSGNRNERRRAGKRWATLPPTVSDTVGIWLPLDASKVFFLDWLPPPRETCPGRRPQAPACFKSGDAQ